MEGQTAIGINSLAVCFYSTMNHGITGGDKLKEADSHCNNCKTHPLTLFARVFFLPPCNSTGWVKPMKPVKNMFVLYFSISKVISILFLRHFFHGNWAH